MPCSNQRLSLQTEIAQAELVQAEQAELLAMTRVRNLDREFADWTLRRESAARDANAAMIRRADAQEKLRRFEVTT
jgi:hypothetical protein